MMTVLTIHFSDGGCDVPEHVGGVHVSYISFYSITLDGGYFANRSYTRHGGALSYPPRSGRISRPKAANSQQLGNDPKASSGL